VFNGGTLPETSVVSEEDLESSLEAWLNVAQATDRASLALNLAEALQDADRGRSDSHVRRAYLLLIAGRAAEARALLKANGAVPPDGPSQAASDLLLAACHAATGDEPAYRWLLSAVSRIGPLTDVGQFGYLVATAADAQGDRQTADQAWLNLAQGSGRVTDLTVRKVIVAEMARRSSDDPEAALRAVFRAVANSDALDSPLDRDPEPVLVAAQELVARGDSAGAMLLLHAVDRLRPPSVDIRSALSTLTPKTSLRAYELRCCGVWGALLGLVAALTVLASQLNLGMLPLAPVLFFRHGLRVVRYKWLPRPGLGKSDSEVSRALSTRHYDALLEKNRSKSENDYGLYGVAAIVGLVTGWILAVQLTSPSGPLASDAFLRSAAWVICLVGLPVLSGFAARFVKQRNLRRHHLRSRAEQHRQRLLGASACQCWQQAYFVGDYAEAYAAQHLTEVGLHEQVLARPWLLPLRFLRCPTSGCLWLQADCSRHLANGGATGQRCPADPSVAETPLAELNQQRSTRGSG